MTFTFAGVMADSGGELKVRVRVSLRKVKSAKSGRGGKAEGAEERIAPCQSYLICDFDLISQHSSTYSSLIHICLLLLDGCSVELPQHVL